MAVAQGQYAVDQTTQQGYYLNNMVEVAEYLMQHGYSPAAAAGVAGDIAGESSGNPEAVGSGGAGLIGWTPPSKAAPYQPIVSGNAQQDFDRQLPDIVYYNSQQGMDSLRQLNAQTDPVAAANYYSSAFERPRVTHSDVRSGVATYVFDKVSGLPTTGNLSSSTPGDVNTNPTQAQTTSFNPLSPSSWLGLLTGGSSLMNMLERLGLVVFGGLLILVGVWMLAGKQTIQLVAPEASAAANAAES
jgi:hypothetical protein